MSGLGIRIETHPSIPPGCAVFFNPLDIERGESLEQAMLRQAKEGKAAIITGLDEGSFS